MDVKNVIVQELLNAFNQNVVPCDSILDIILYLPWVCETNWIDHGTGNKQCERWKTLFNSSFYEIDVGQ